MKCPQQISAFSLVETVNYRLFGQELTLIAERDDIERAYLVTVDTFWWHVTEIQWWSYGDYGPESSDEPDRRHGPLHWREVDDLLDWVRTSNSGQDALYRARVRAIALEDTRP